MAEKACKSARFPMFVHMFCPKFRKYSRRLLIGTAGCLLSSGIYAQQVKKPSSILPARRWADSVMRHMDTTRKIAQLLMIRVYNPPSPEQAARVEHEIQDLGVGGIVFFQGDPVQQALLTNQYQSMSAIPLWVGIDGEWGLAMRLLGVQPFPKQMQLGALPDASLIYQMGCIVGAQCKRMGIQINFAPDADINNNPDNPVINDRSFGENKFIVARYARAYMQGMQEEGIIAVAKHFPGHGDTEVDSHQDLPVVDKTLRTLDTLELYPFRQLIRAGVKGIMVGHLHVPAIDSTSHMPASLSRKIVTGLLKQRMGYKGLVFTDALDMKGVTNYFQHGEAALQALLAGNDVLVLPENVEEAIDTIAAALRQHRLSMAYLDSKVRRILETKYQLGLAHWQPVDTTYLLEDLNRSVRSVTKLMDDSSFVVLGNDHQFLPFSPESPMRIAYVGVGLDTTQTDFARDLRAYHPVDTYFFPASSPWENIAPLAKKLKYDYDAVIVGVHRLNRYPAHHFGLSEAEILLIQQLQQEARTVTVLFGNPYALQDMHDGEAIVVAYEDDSLAYATAAALLFGRMEPGGRLAVSVSGRYQAGSGLTAWNRTRVVLPYVQPEQVGVDPGILKRIDTLAQEAIAAHATPGCVVLAARDGKIFFHKAYGYLDNGDTLPVQLNTIYDMASCTKVSATTLAAMRLYDEGKLNLDAGLGKYLPWLRGSDKAPLTIRDVMLHQAGLVAWIPFYKNTLYDGVHPDTVLYSHHRDPVHTVRVAENLYINPAYLDSMYMQIRNSKLIPGHRYVYSDNDFILMQKVVEAITGMRLDEYVEKTFYAPLGLTRIGFRPRSFASLNEIAPTENEKQFRLQQLHGDVHDPGAAMFGGISGHAGLFADAYDLAVLMQMLLNGGTLNGQHFLKPSTIQYFTGYRSDISRRGLGWDKPEKDRMKDPEPYPCASASPLTFGHTGFTGTCIWVDPAYKLTFIFLSNRVYPDGGANMKLIQMNIRGRIQQTLYDAMGVQAPKSQIGEK
ncbi:beta-glucosidase [Thermoflavifilum thermophilum]|uniref:beta-N-acetylhexosaminidase n=1 Tax=Thermoflavifilum thermophilum TaxID=1393122 RepID=A0A1I7ND17_9BACT|nr:beta-glucosidase [Thermoflavifilum thermophilum]